MVERTAGACGQKRVNFSLQTKIMGLIAALLILVIGLLTVTFAVQQTKEGRKQSEQLAVQTAKPFLICLR